MFEKFTNVRFLITVSYRKFFPSLYLLLFSVTGEQRSAHLPMATVAQVAQWQLDN